jgi:ABC-type dipeptide/oligopeptide/nickel transport system ATPase component
MIAIALLSKPALVLADEPTTALDVLVQKEILELLFRLQKEMAMSILLISHNLALVAQYTQRLAVMRQGQIVEEQASGDLFRHPRDAYTKDLIRAVPTIPPVS